jgi:hypothetical protein
MNEAFTTRSAVMLLENNDTMPRVPRIGNEPLTEVDAAARLGLKVST